MEDFQNPFKGEIVDAPVGGKRSYRRFQQRSRTSVLILCAALLLLGVIAVIMARPLHSKVKGWRAARLLAESEQLIAQEKWEDALKKAHAAALLVPQDPRSMRLVARAFSHFGSERALDFWQYAVALTPENQDDRRQLAETALHYLQISVASGNVAVLLAQSPDDLRNLRLAAKVARAKNDSAAELRLLQRAGSLAPNDPEIDFLLCRAYVEAGDQSQKQASLAKLREMAEKPERAAIEALQFFLSRPVADYPDRLRLAELLEGNPFATITQRINACAVGIQVDPSSRSVRLDRLVQPLSGKDPETLAPVGEWLLRTGESARMLELIPSDLAQQSERLALLRADALSRDGDGEKLEQFLTTPGLKLREEFVHFCRWQASLEAGRSSGHDREARAAIDAAGNRPSSLAYIAERFEKLDRGDLASQAYAKLRETPKFEMVGLFGLIRIARRSQDTKLLQKLLEQARQGNTGEPRLQAEAIQVALLLRENIEENRAAAAALAATNPNQLVIQTAHALALLRSGEPADALDVYKKQRFDWQRATPSERAVFAAILRHSGHEQEASRILVSLPADELLPEERQLLSE